MESRLIALAETCDPDAAVCLSDFTKAVWDNGGVPVNLGGPLLTTPGGIITRALPYLFSIAGIILFIMLMWGGFEVFFGATDPKSAESGKQRITNALVGFGLLFSVYWIAQILQVLFGISLGVGN
jgi:hypothetical protein